MTPGCSISHTELSDACLLVSMAGFATGQVKLLLLVLSRGQRRCLPPGQPEELRAMVHW